MAIKCLSWNVNGAEFRGPSEKGGNALSDGLSYIVNTLNDIDADLVALQELPCGKAELTQVSAAFKTLKIYSPLKYMILSSSHVRPGGKLGLGILSKYPLVKNELKHLFPVPDIPFYKEDKTTESLHEKGAFRICVKIGNRIAEFGSMHLPPFRTIARTIGEVPFSGMRSSAHEFIAGIQNEFILGADINMDSVRDLLPRVAFDHLREAISGPTHWHKGVMERSDQLLYSKHLRLRFSRTFSSRFDHRPCYGEFFFEGDEKDIYEPKEDSERSDVTILHLSDLHYGKDSAEISDTKVLLDGAERVKVINRLERFCRSIHPKPDFVIVSGDITTRGDQQGFENFTEALKKCIESSAFPSARHIVIVPGNHDVDRNISPRSAERWDGFKKRFGLKHVIPWLPNADRPDVLMRKFLDLDITKLDLIGGGDVKNDGYEPTSLGLPFVFDKTKGVFIYAFNSAMISGTKIVAGKPLEEYLKALNTTDTSAQKENLLRVFNELVSVDPARIEYDELDLFDQFIYAFRQKIPNDFQRAVKIAILHHHVTPFISEEVKQFEFLMNAGQFKKHLVDAGFHIVMHGHKHVPDMLIDSALSDEKRLIIVAGATVGGMASGSQNGFNILRVERDTRDLHVHRHFVPVTADAPESAVSKSMESPAQSKSTPLRPDDFQRPENATKSGAELFDEVEERILSEIRTSIDSANRTVAGWNNYLSTRIPSVLGTSYGVAILATLECQRIEFVSKKPAITEFLLSQRRENRYWSATALGEPGQPLESCIVLAALFELGWPDAQAAADSLLSDIRAQKWPTLLQSTVAVGMVLRFAIRHCPTSPIIEQLMEILLDSACYDDENNIMGWGIRTGENFSSIGSGFIEGGPSGDFAPSVPRTAVVILAWLEAKKSKGSLPGRLDVDLSKCCERLLHTQWSQHQESVEEGGKKFLILNLPSELLATQALLRSGVDPTNENIRKTVNSILDKRVDGLWKFDTATRATWHIYEVVQMLKAYVMARRI